MQEEVNNKTVALVVRASKLTATTLYDIAETQEFVQFELGQMDT